MTYQLPEIPGLTWRKYDTRMWLLVRVEHADAVTPQAPSSHWVAWISWPYLSDRDTLEPALVSVGFHARVTNGQDQHILGYDIPLEKVTAELLIPHLAKAAMMGWI